MAAPPPPLPPPQPPAMVQLLLQEAQAWATLLQVHESMVTSGTSVARQSSNALEYNDAAEQAAQREQAYLTGLTGLAALADTLVGELVKLRALRRGRRDVEIAALAEITRQHTNGFLGLGESTCRQAMEHCSSLITQVRSEAQRTRTELTQLRALLQVVFDARQLQLPVDQTVVVGLLSSDGTALVRPVEEILHAAHQHGGLSETSLAAALTDAAVATPPSADGRRFPRRADRTLATSSTHPHADAKGADEGGAEPTQSTSLASVDVVAASDG